MTVIIVPYIMGNVFMWTEAVPEGLDVNPSENRHEGEIAKSRDMVAVEAF